MTYIDILNAFWNWRRFNVIPHSAADLYFCLLDFANSAKWEDKITIPNSRIMGKIDISEKSLFNTRNILVQNGLIEYKIGKKGQAGTYKIILTTLYFFANNESNQGSNSRAIKGAIAEQSREHNKEKEKEKDKDKNINPLIPFEGKLLESVNLWLAYKAERGQKYKPTGLQTLFKKIQDGVTEYGEAAVIRSIDNSIANNWQGLFFKPSEKSAESGNPFLDMLKDSGALEDGELF